MVTQYIYLQLKIIFIIQTIFFNKFYLLYVSEKVESAFEKIHGLLPKNYESLRIKVIVKTLNHNFNFMVFSKQYLTLRFRNIADKRRRSFKTINLLICGCE